MKSTDKDKRKIRLSTTALGQAIKTSQALALCNTAVKTAAPNLTYFKKLIFLLQRGLQTPYRFNYKLAFVVLVCLFKQANAATYNVTSTANSGAGTLNQAITDANANVGADIIAFNINGTGPFTITLSSLLPIITGPTTINGYSQSGAIQGVIGSRTIMIAVNAGSVIGRDGLFRFTAGASGSSLSGLSIYNTGPNIEAVQIEPGCSNIQIWGNYIGLLPNGTSPALAADFNGDDGVFLGDYSAATGAFANIAIGTNSDNLNDANEGNVISNSADATNGGDGIQIGRNLATYTWSNVRVSGNYIGVAADGITAAPNGIATVGTLETSGQDGINLRGATNILIGSDANGTSDAFERNIISGNNGNGIGLGNTNSAIRIAGNYIGTDKTGTTAVPNGKKSNSSSPFCGILVSAFSGGSDADIVIGFDDAVHTAANASAARNVISGNTGLGIQFSTVTGASNKIAGNYIGVDANGNTALGNGWANIAHPSTVVFSAGVDVFATSNLVIGTDGDGDDDTNELNVISGNIDATGVNIRNGSSANILAGNYIGVGANGTTAVGNDFPGIHINASNNNRIGSNDDGTSDAAEANIIANNAKSPNASFPSTDGVRIANGAVQNRISRNVFYSNNATPIDLANDGVSVNDGTTSAGQPNILVDYPVFTAYSISGTTITVSGYVGQCNGNEPIAGTTIIGTTTVQVYKAANDGDQNGAITANGCSRSLAHGEGIQYLGSITVTDGVFTNATFTLAAGASFTSVDKLTGITIDVNGNTSEFGVDLGLGYIYVHKKSLNEVNQGFSFSVSGGATVVPAFTLNDEPTQLSAFFDIGASENGRLWAACNGGALYYRDANSTVWVQTGIVGVSRVDGGPGGTCYFINSAGTAFSYDVISAQVQISSTGRFNSGGGFQDIASGWTGTPTSTVVAGLGTAVYAVNNDGNVYKWNGPGTTTWGTYTTIGGTQYRMDINPTNGNVYVGRDNGGTIRTILQITPAATPVVTSLGSPVADNSAYKDIAVNQNGEIYAVATDVVNAPTGAYVFKFVSGTTWTKEAGSFDAIRITGGVANSLWSTMNSGGWGGGSGWAPAAGPYPFYNIFSRAFDGTNITYIDDERVRTTTGNSELIAVAPGTYTIAEAAAAGWDLQKILVYDPSTNSTSDQVAATATINVSGGEVIHVVYQNGQLNPIVMTNSCTAAYLETFGVGTSVGTPTTTGSFGSPIAGQTSYHYLAGNAPGEDGYYKIVNRANPDFNTWSGAAGVIDHTPGDGALGYMYAVNAGFDKGEFFRRRFTGVIPGAIYNFSAWVVNLTATAPVNPNLSFLVLDHTTQAILGSYNTGELTSTTEPGTWQQYGFSFTATATDIDLVIGNNGFGGNGNDLALDDISFALSPPVAPVTTVVNLSCSTTVGSINVTSPLGATYAYSKDGINWQSSPLFDNLAVGTYAISVRFVSTPDCIASKMDTVKAAICGNVYHDANGITDNTVFGSPTNISGSLIAILYDNTTGKVADTVYVKGDGTFTLHGAVGDNYSIYLSSTPATIGQAAIPTVALPSGWVNTGEKLGTGTGTDGVANGILPIGVVSTTTSNINFGVEQRPETNNQLLNITKNVTAGTIYSFPSLLNLTSDSDVPQLSGSDPEDKPASPTDSISTGGTFVITTLPPATQAILYYNGTPIGAGVVITNYDPAKLQIEFKAGLVTTSFQYVLSDAAGIRDLSPATYQINILGILPATGLNLTAQKIESKLTLLWQTLTETNTTRFDVELSSDGTNYQTIGTVKAAGNSNAQLQYSFNHTMPSMPVLYYRISLVNKDGKRNYSNIVRTGISNTLTLYPNPATTSVVIGGLTGKNTVQLFNATGKMLIEEPATSSSKTINLQGIAKGIYWVKLLQANQSVKVFKLVKE